MTRTREIEAAASAASRDYCLDILASIRRGLDLTDTWLLMTVGQANHEPMMRRPADLIRFGTWESPTPFELRRPVSVARLADSAGLPYETARRRSGQLCRAGLLIERDHGLLVPEAMAHSEVMRELVHYAHGRTRRLFLDLAEIGLVEDLPTLSRRPASAVPLVRATHKLCVTYLMRMSHIFREPFGDLADVVIFLTIARCNVEHLGSYKRTADGLNGWPWIDDSDRRPVTLAQIASRTRLNRETVRRRIGRLTETQRILRTESGYIVPDDALNQPDLGVLAEPIVAELQRLLRRLREIGVTPGWAAEVPLVAARA